MKYAIIELNGKQHKVSEGQQFTVDNIAAEVGNSIKVDKVLMVADDKTQTFGQPMVKNASVTLEVIEAGRGDKIRVATFKAKARQRKVIGHRQNLHTLKVASISLK